MAEQEGDTIIGAGVPDKIPATLDEALAELERLHRIYIQACTGRSEFRKALRDSRAREAALAARVKGLEEALVAANARADAITGDAITGDSVILANKAQRFEKTLATIAGCDGLSLGDVLDIAQAALSPAASDEGR